MVVKPNEHLNISNERSVALVAIIERIDQILYRERGAQEHHLSLEQFNPLVSAEFKGWLYDELARVYSEEGQWRYVTVFLETTNPTGVIYSYHWLYLSNRVPFSTRVSKHTSYRHLAGAEFFAGANQNTSLALMFGAIFLALSAFVAWLVT